jgi:acetyl esterase
MLLCYGVYDANFDTDSYLRFDGANFNLGREEMRQYLASYVAEKSDYSTPLVSPLRADLRSLPQTYMVIAECDVLHDENVEMAKRLKHSGVDVRSKVYPGTTHSFLEAVSMAEISRAALSDVSDWLRDAFRRV